MISASQWLLTYLLNSLWQVPVIAAAAIIAAHLMAPAGWRARYRLFVAALLLAILLPAWSATTSMPKPGQSTAVTILPGGGLDGNAAAFAKTAHIQRHYSASLRMAPLITAAIVVAYLAFVLYRAGILAWKWRATQRLRRNASTAELPGELAALWRSCKASFRLAEVDLLTSTGIPGPVTLGFRGVALLVPPDFIARATHEEISAALCHEFAHIARHDYLVNLLLEIAGLPIAFHPACWLLKKQIDESRELACDAMAAPFSSGVASSGSEVYARSLLSLAQTICASPAATYTTALGIFEANILEKRIMNLIDRKPTSTPAARIFCGLFGCLVLAASSVAISVFTLQPASAQSNSGLQAFLGTWKTTVNGQPAAIVGLMSYQGKLTGSISNGAFGIDEKNNAITGWRDDAPGGFPIVEASVVGQTLTFKTLMTPETGETAAWDLTLTAPGQAELRIPSEATRTGARLPTIHAEKVDTTPTKDEAPHDNTTKPSAEEGTTPPNVISSVDPNYTPEARAAKISGTCLLGLTITEQGIPTNVHIVRSLDRGLDENAIKAVQQYRFTPAMKDGVPFAKDVKIEVNFQIY